MLIWADSSYRGEEFMQWVFDTYRWSIEVVLRRHTPAGFGVIPKRWIVEQTFGWFFWCRRLSKDYEVLPQTSTTFITPAML